MRTTINIDDALLEKARRLAERSGSSFRSTLNRVLQAGLDKLDPRPRREQYRPTAYSMGFPPAANMDKALDLASLLEDEESVRKLLLKK